MDVNSDGKQDLAAVSRYSSSLKVVLNTCK